MFAGDLGLILIFPYSYLIACIIVSLFDVLKKKRWLLVFAIIILIFLLGVDEPVINNTINLPDYSCLVDSDCIEKSISEDWCGNSQCLNKNWGHYNSLINNVLGLSCQHSYLSCSCEKNKCKTTDIYKSIDIRDCEKLREDYQKKQCREIVSHNIVKTQK